MKKKRGRVSTNKRSLTYHLMLLVPAVIVFIYCYVRIMGNIMAFQNFYPGLGFFKSDWVGLENFKILFMMPDTLPAIRNTLLIAVAKIIGNLIVPVTFALLLNEVRLRWFKRTVQTITYLPYFLSWVILSGILINFLSPGSTADGAGFFNSLLMKAGSIKEPVFFLGNKQTFPATIIISDIWKNFGFNTIVYLAALTGIDPGLYEAASVDGAGRFSQTIHITLPGISQIIVLMTILSIGNVLNAGFDQIFNLYSPAVYETGDIIDTLVYRLGLVNQQYSLSAAVGLFKSVVSMILIVASYRIADKYAGYKVF